MRVAIMQPTYLPWIGYFAMIDIVDLFIFYDDVQFVKSSWHHRNKIKMVNEEIKWLSVPCLKEHLNTNINEVYLKTSMSWERKHWLNIYHSYCKAPHFIEYESELKKIYEVKWEKLVDLNLAIITLMTDLMKINKPEFIKSSQLSNLSGKKTDRVIDVLSKVGASEYISTEGTKAYLDTDVKKFKDRNISFKWFNYRTYEYPQMGNGFVPYLSAIDLMFNNGESSIEHLRKGLINALEPVD